MDAGTSIVVGAHVRPDFTADTALRTVADLVEQQGVPHAVTIDRDPRFVGSAQQRDFPSPFVRFWLCLGVHVTICPPHRPDLNPFVERYHRSFEYACLRIYRPYNLETATAVTAAYQRFYNEERPVRHEVAPHEWNRDSTVSKPRLVSKPVPNHHMHSWQQECVKLEITPKKASSHKM